MATATQVDIKIVVDSTKAVAGVQQASKAFDGFSMVMTQDEQNAQRLARTMDLTGNKAIQLGGHMATPLDAVRLLSQEFGFRLPRAMEAMLSRMPAVTEALGSLLGGMAAVAGIEVFARVVQGAKQAYDEFISLNAVIDKYNEGLEKARQADLPNARSIETTQLRLRDQTHIAALQADAATSSQNDAKGDFRKAAALTAVLGPAGMLLGGAHFEAQGAYGMLYGQDEEKKAVIAAAARDALTRRNIEATHEQALAQIELNHAQDATLTGAQKINAEAQKKKDLATETKVFQNQMDRSAENGISPTAGQEEERTKVQTADDEANAQKVVLNREMNLAIMKSTDARIQAALQGEALYTQKLKDDIKEVTQELVNQGKAAEIPARIREINEKYYQDSSERFVKAQSESAARSRQASAAGLTGAARIYADQYNQVNENNTKLGGDERGQANIAAKREANNKLLELQRQFTEQMDGIAEGQTAATLNGYARIDAEAKKTADHIQEEFTKSWGGAEVDQASQQYIAARKAMQDALTAVDQGAAARRRGLADQEAEETLRYDDQAAQAQRRIRRQGLLGFVSDYQAAMAEIRAQEQARERELKNQLAKGDVDWKNYTQRMEDVHSEASAQIIAQQQQMQHQIAGNLQEAFTDPLQFIKSKMEQMFFEVIAAWIMRMQLFKNLFGQTMGGLQIGGGQPGGAQPGGGGLLGGIFGGGQPGTANTAQSGGGVFAGAASIAQPTFSGQPTLSPSGPTPIGSAIPGSGGMVMTSSGPVPTLSPAQQNFAGGGGSAVYSSLSQADSLVNTLHPNSAGTMVPTSSGPIPVRNPNAPASEQTGPGTLNSLEAFGVNSKFTSATTPNQPGAGTPSIAGGGPDVTATHNPQATVPSANNTSQSGAAGVVSKGQGLAAAGFAAYAGYGATKEAYMSDSIGGTFKGAAQDAMAGAAIGMMFGGPVGALIGAGIGAAVGLTAGVAGMITGQGPRLKARDYYRQTLFPAIEGERNSDTADYQTAISNVNRTASEGLEYMAIHFGSDAARWVNDNYLKKEQQLADAQIEERAKGGQYAVQMSAAQFHTGGRIAGFGDFATSSDEGFIHALKFETVMNRPASSTHGPFLDAMNSGASHADMARMYLDSSRSSGASAPGGSSSGAPMHVTIQALDSKSFEHSLRNGGARTISKHLNALTDAYAGDAAHG